MYAVAVVEGEDGFDVTVDDRAYRVTLSPWVGSTHFRLAVDGAVLPVAIMRSGDGWRVVIGHEQHRLRLAPRVPIHRRSAVTSAPADVQVLAPMPGLIVAVHATPGSPVPQGAPVVIMEAMKMQMEIRAPASGRIRAVRARAGQEVSKGQVLLELETAG